MVVVHSTLVETRFWNHVDKTETCWLWNGKPNKDGYGRLQVSGYPREAHRISWEINVGPIPSGMYVCHQCDIKICVRPDHLYIGTGADNISDTFGGERNWRAKLTLEQVDHIRKEYNSDGISYAELGRKYGVSGACVWRIIAGKSWVKMRRLARNGGTVTMGP